MTKAELAQLIVNTSRKVEEGQDIFAAINLDDEFWSWVIYAAVTCGAEVTETAHEVVNSQLCE